ncbi:hypothetical protein SELMODRAFT_408008 [Selaginella moellendorffii]|uniref:Transcription initiation factor TFIID subunit 2 n=1 Tax=Selaginella moellendorffii TaxID=88036 RepID=D8R6W9_SELML|nr:hypothetical protein SELMODRAFT_408008 [Selaginella moellendorffii]
MEHESIVGHTELDVASRNSVGEFHSGGLEILQVLVDGVPAKFERKRRTPNSSQQASPRVQSLQTAAATAYSSYKAVLAAESSPDLFITLSAASPSQAENLCQENGSSQDVPKLSTAQPVKLVQIHFALEKSKSKIFFSTNLFQTHRVQHWFPCLGSMSSRCSSYHLEFTVQSDYVAVSAGNLLYQVLSKEGNMKTYVYNLDVPTPASFVTLVSTPLEVIPERQNANVSHMCPPGFTSKLQSSVNCYYSLFSLYEEYLGAEFPFGSYKQVFIDSEHSVASLSVGASMAVFSSHLLVDERVIDQAIITQIKLSQALAQQWFGVFITPETDRDVWLLEGISGFLVHLFIRKFLGNNEALYRKFKAIEAVTDADVESFPPLSPSSVPAGVFRAEKLGLLGKIRLWKAVTVIQMLEKQMGPESLRKVLQRIVSRAGEPCFLSSYFQGLQFRHFANKIGNLERPFLKEFFPRWVESQGCPLLRMGFEYNKRRNIVEFAVHRDCTAPEVMMLGNKSIADVGWPGMMNIQIHELDGMYDHPNLSLSGDVHQLLEIPCHSKMANRRPQRPKKPGKVEIIDDLADDKPSVESPLLWLRADPGMDYLTKIQLWQPEQMWINQLERDKDAVAQLQAIAALQKLPVSFSIVFCRVRVEAAFALANTAGEGTSWLGLGHLMKYYKSRCFDMEIGLPRPNSFHDFSEYFVLQAIPPAVGTVRGNQGKSPPEAVEFILNILKHNDNSGNAYSDSFWLSSVIESVGELEISQQSIPKFARILKQIDRYFQYDRLMPSYNCILTRSCIQTLTRLALKFNTVISLAPIETLLSPFKVLTTPWQVRVAALQAQLDMKFQSESLNSSLRVALDFVREDPCARVQCKVMSYALRICLRKHASTSSVDSSTVSSLLEFFESEQCAVNHKLRHYIFSILQVLAGKPATLLRVSRLPPKGPVLLSPTGKKDDVDVSKLKKAGKLTLRLKSSTFQNADALLKLPSPTTAPESVKSAKSSTIDQPQAAKPSSSSSQAAEASVLVGPEKMDIDDSLGSSQFKDLIEVIDVNPVPEAPVARNEAVDEQVAEASQKEERKEKKDKDRKDKKEKKKEKKEKKDKKDRKEKKEKKHKDKKHKKDKDRHKREGTEQQPKNENQSPGSDVAVVPASQVNESETAVRQPSILLKVKQEISDANMSAPPVQASSATSTPPPQPQVTATKRPGEGGFKLKIKRPKVEAVCAGKKLRRSISSSAGPSVEHLRAVPFTRSREDARSDYDAYHSSVISYVPSLSPSVKERFLPFWAVCSVAKVAIDSAQIGYLKHRYNFATKRMETYTSWQLVYFSKNERPSWERRHDPNEDLDMQIYASYEYRRAYVNGLRCVGCFSGATRLTPEMVEGPDGVRGLEEFRMNAQAALDLAKTAVYRQAQANARDFLLRIFPGSWDARGINLDFLMDSVLVAPIYVPVYIFESSYFTEMVRTFVHGARSSAVGGQRLYHAPLAAIGGGMACAAMAYHMSGSVPLGACVVAATIASTVALLFPVLVLRFREWWRVRESAQHVWRDWGQEYVNAYEMWEELARKQQTRREEARQRRFYEEQTRYRRSDYSRQRQEEPSSGYGGGGSNPDPKGYYARLGLQPGASESEIKAAFRALALKHHPDRHQDPGNKAKAKANFVRITEAYEVLRDPNKRREYQQQRGY